MSKLSLDALKERAEAIASEELLATISGGIENSCHTTTTDPANDPKIQQAATTVCDNI